MNPEDGELEDDSVTGLPSVLLELAAVVSGVEEFDAPVVSRIEEEDETPVLSWTDDVDACSLRVIVMVE